MRIQQLQKIQDMNAKEMDSQMMRTFFTLRTTLVGLSFLLPVTLLVYSFATHGYLAAGSISEFYGHNNGAMRDYFVATLCGAGVLLILYKGYSLLENWLLNFAGGFVILTAFVPCDCWNPQAEKNTWHGLFAIAFFACVGTVCLFCANQTVGMLPESKQKFYTTAYRAIGFWLFAGPIGAYALARIAGRPNRAVFVIEFALITVFSAYWALKSKEIKETKTERLAIYGALANENGKVVRRKPDIDQWQRMSA